MSERVSITLSMTERGMNSVASHWWVMVPMAVSMYMSRHFLIKGMLEKTAVQ